MTITTCSNGHPQSVANVYVSPKGYRSCRVCNREKRRRIYERDLRAADPYGHRVEHPGSRHA